MKINVHGYEIEGTPEEMIRMMKILKQEKKEKGPENDGGVERSR